MKAADVAITPACEECGTIWLAADPARWQAHRIDDPFDENDPPALGFFCPDCSERDSATTRTTRPPEAFLRRVLRVGHGLNDERISAMVVRD